MSNQKFLSSRYGIAAQVLELLNDLFLIVENDSVHPERASGQDILYFVIDEDGAGWVDS